MGFLLACRRPSQYCKAWRDILTASLISSRCSSVSRFNGLAASCDDTWLCECAGGGGGCCCCADLPASGPKSPVPGVCAPSPRCREKADALKGSGLRDRSGSLPLAYADREPNGGCADEAMVAVTLDARVQTRMELGSRTRGGEEDDLEGSRKGIKTIHPRRRGSAQGGGFFVRNVCMYNTNTGQGRGHALRSYYDCGRDDAGNAKNGRLPPPQHRQAEPCWQCQHPWHAVSSVNLSTYKYPICLFYLLSRKKKKKRKEKKKKEKKIL